MIEGELKKCDEIDQHLRKERSDKAYCLVKEVSGKKKCEKRTQAILHENGTLQTDKNQHHE